MNKVILSMFLIGVISSTILEKLSKPRKRDDDKNGQCKIIPDLEKQEKALLEAKDAKNKEYNAFKDETNKEIAHLQKKIDELNKKLQDKLNDATKCDAENDKARDELKKRIAHLKKECADRKDNSKTDKKIIKIIGATRNLNKKAKKHYSSSSDSCSGDAWGTDASINSNTDGKVAAESEGNGSTMISAHKGGIDAFAEGERGGKTAGSFGANISQLNNSFAVSNHKGHKSAVLNKESNNLNVDARISTAFKGQGTALAHAGLHGISGGAQGTKGTKSLGGFASNESNILNSSAILSKKK